MTDVLVLGSGVAGLSAAVRARRRRARRSPCSPRASSAGRPPGTRRAAWPRRSIEDDDSPELHGSDTLAAGGGLCDADAVRVLVTEGPARVRELMALGAHFDRRRRRRRSALGPRGRPLGRAGRARRRRRDRRRDRAGARRRGRRQSGAEVREGWLAIDLLVEDGRAVGVHRPSTPTAARARVARPAHRHRDRRRRAVLRGHHQPARCRPATASRWRCGPASRCADLEFMQFHPTALHHPSMPRPLLSEALRGEGAILRDEHGVAFMADEHPLADLAPRDVVAQAISRRAQRARPRPPVARRHRDRRASRRASRRSGAACQTRRARPDPRLAAGRAGRALPLGRRLHRPRRRDDAPGPVGVRRGGVLRRARREPAGVELAARRPRVRGAGRSRRSSRARTRREPTGVLRGIEPRRRRRAGAVAGRHRRPARRSATSCSGS